MSQALILPVNPVVPKMVWEYQDGVGPSSLNGLVQIASKLVFQRDSESEEANFHFSINNLLELFIIYFNFEK